MASEIIEKERQNFVKILQQDPDSILDTLISRNLISEEEYEILDTVTDPLKKSRKMLILVQKKGERSCQQFLECLHSAFPESTTGWWSILEFVKQEKGHEKAKAPIFTEENKNSEVTLLSEKKQYKSTDDFMFVEEESQNLKTTGSLGNKGLSNSEVSLSSKEKEEEGDDDKLEDTVYSEDREAHEDLEAIVYLGEEWEDENPDIDLYLGEEDYAESVAYFEEPGSAEEEEASVEYTEYYGENDPDNFRSSDDEQNYENLETEVSLEEEAANLEERRKTFKEILSCLEMDRNRKLLPSFVQQFQLDHGCHWIPQTSADLSWNFLVKIQCLDVTARDTVLSQRVPGEDVKEGLITKVENMGLRDKETINPLDVLCAIMLCSDNSLQQEVLGNMFKCHFALPLLLPDAENNKCLLMLDAMKNIVPKDSIHSGGDAAEIDTKSLVFMKMPLISFVRLGYCGSSKSKILNTLLSTPQKQPLDIFHHRDSHASLLPRQISDGLVEITWSFPNSSSGKENLDFFQEPVAVANLRGDLECFWTQFGFLMEVSSAVFIFIDCPGEREWDLLAFLGEAAKERCYFILSPQSRESEEAQLFQRILKLKPSQLLLLEENDMGDRGRYVEGLQIALKEVMCSPLRHVSVEDMASLARELGIQVDQDCEKAQGIQETLNEVTAEVDEVEVPQRYTQPRNLPESQCHTATGRTRIFRGVSPQCHSFHHTTSFTPCPWAWCPPLTRSKGNLYWAPLRPQWAMGSTMWPGFKPRWLGPLAFHNRRANIRGRNPGRWTGQPQRIHQAAALVKSPRSPQVHHLSRPPRPISQIIRAPYQGLQSKEIIRANRVAFQAGHLRTQGPQPAGTFIRPMRPNFHVGWSRNPGCQHVEVTKKSVGQTQKSGQYQITEAESTKTSVKIRRPASQAVHTQSEGSKLGRTSGQQKKQGSHPGTPGTQRSQPPGGAGQPVKSFSCTGSSMSQRSQPDRTTGRPIRPACQPGANKYHQTQTTKPASQTGHSYNPNSKSSSKSQAKPPQSKPSCPPGGPKRRGK